MRFSVLTVLALVAVCAAASDDIKRAPLLAADSPTAVEGEYIVVLKEELADQDVSDHKAVVRNLMGFHNSSEIMFEYSIGKGFRGYSAKMTDKLRDTVLAMNHIKYMERNQEVHIDQAQCVNQKGATWGLARTINRDFAGTETDYDYADDAAGEGVDAYIIDTGIEHTHPDFGGRAKQGADFIDSPPNGGDPHGHGTHVAGTVMSNTYGLARKATSIAVRVLNAGGSGSVAGVIAGINYVATDGSGKKSVANMSLGGGFSATENEAVNAAVKAGVHFSVSAGNNGGDACFQSPASAEMPVTVCASDRADQFASFSNYGTCTDIIGPGVDVISTWPMSKGGTATLSGTSMSAPHIAGVIAKMLSEQQYEDITPEEMKIELGRKASKDKIKGIRGPIADTKNDLVYHGCPDVPNVHAN